MEMKKVKVVVGTESALKLRATGAAFVHCGFDAEIIGCKVDSGISVQPFGLEEMECGARNRFLEARKQHLDGDFFVGIESGLVQGIRGAWFDVICVMVASKAARVSSPAYSTYFPIPTWIVDYIKMENCELGAVAQKLAGGGEKDVLKHLSNGLFRREDQLQHTIIAALIPLLHWDRYRLPGMD